MVNLRGGGRGTFERRELQEEEEEGLTRGGGRGTFERRRREFVTPSSSSSSLFLFILNYILCLSLDVPLHVGQNEEEQPIRGRECRSK